MCALESNLLKMGWRVPIAIWICCFVKDWILADALWNNPHGNIFSVLPSVELGLSSNLLTRSNKGSFSH